MYSKILTSALIAGAAAGLFASLLQFVFMQPVLLHAEMFESGAMVNNGNAAAAFEMPPIEVMRNLLTVAFYMLIYSGFGLVLIALMMLAESQGATISARTGIAWGVAGFVAVHLATGFGLAPEVPGTSAASVSIRQVWWFGTIVATATGLWLTAFGKNWIHWAIAIVALAIPHIIGAPEPEVYTGTAPTELGGMFAARSLGVAFTAWVVLGMLAGLLWSRAEDS